MGEGCPSCLTNGANVLWLTGDLTQVPSSIRVRLWAHGVGFFAVLGDIQSLFFLLLVHPQPYGVFQD